MRMVSAFDKALQFCKEIDTTEETQKAYSISCEDSFDEFLNYLREINSITDDFALRVLKIEMYLYDLDDDNYYEVDLDKQELLYDKVFNGKQQELDEWYSKQEND